ncbi:transcriptional regulator with XRE-family HTH domain [Hamadaea flava]|uniref:Helix-turn-helix domain-containing protein n=1 Tax=Hamadaea flava TaxID=1742688 RepID=A0ABV8LKJ5_9ACTN|nr:helix-turn-helix transcriptional regulator [Hamadaea flava]MCP2325035.1 transcriptional regulator with XRE-family HTH domain [Hamadaea flava]
MEPATSRLHGPTIARRRLSQALRAARDDTGRTQEQAADALDWSISKMIRIENGKTKPTVTDVKALLQLYGVTEATEIAEFVDLARATRQRSWWAEYRDQLPAGYAEYVALESDASSLSFFQPLAVPGLLQTPEYARAILRTATLEGLSGEDQERRATVRQLRRQHLVEAQARPQISIVLDEAVLLRVAGSPEVMREQLEYLAGFEGDAKIQIRVLPFSAGVHAITSSFIIMEFPSSSDADLVYAESALTLPTIVDSADASAYWKAYRWLESVSLSSAESYRRIAEGAQRFH